MHAVMLQDVKPKTHAMTRPINTPDEISKIYDFVAYPKAASVIRMIEHIMSPEMFQESLNSYILERWRSTFLRLRLCCIREARVCEFFIAKIPKLFAGATKLQQMSSFMKLWSVGGERIPTIRQYPKSSEAGPTLLVIPSLTLKFSSPTRLRECDRSCSFLSLTAPSHQSSTFCTTTLRPQTLSVKRLPRIGFTKKPKCGTHSTIWVTMLDGLSLTFSKLVSEPTNSSS